MIEREDDTDQGPLLPLLACGPGAVAMEGRAGSFLTYEGGGEPSGQQVADPTPAWPLPTLAARPAVTPTPAGPPAH